MKRGSNQSKRSPDSAPVNSSDQSSGKGQKSSKRVGRKVLYFTLGGIVTVVLGFGIVVEQLRPMNHFRLASLPVLASPQQQASATAQGQSVESTKAIGGPGAGEVGGTSQAQSVSDNNVVSIGSVGEVGAGSNGGSPSVGGTGSNTGSMVGSATGSGAGGSGGGVGLLATARSSSKSTPQRGQFNVLLLGNDARAPGQPSHTDSIIVVHVDLVRHQYQMMSIPRDTYVDLPGYGWTKITHASFMGDLSGGPSVGLRDAIKAISNLTGLDINYYAETNYWGLKDIVDAVGGIEMFVPFQVTLTHPWYGQEGGSVIQAGMHQVNGEEVADLTHERYSLANGDFGRQQLQEEALLGIARKLSQPANLSKLPSVLKNLSQYLVATNMSTSDMLSLAVGLRNFTTDEVHYYQVPGTPIYALDPIVGTKLYYWVPNTKLLQAIIAQHFEG